jgi:hypothetical protein
VFLLEANHLGPLMLVVDISYAGKVLLTRVMKSEGVTEGAFEPAVEEVPCLDLSLDHSEEALPSPTQMISVSAASPGQAAAVAMPAVRKPFLLRTAGMAAASVLVLAGVFGVWHAKRGAQQETAAVSSARQPSVEPAPQSVTAAAPPPSAEPTSPPSPSKPEPPPNYLLCAFGSGATVFGIPRTLTLAQIMNGLQATCGFSGTGETYDVTIHWQFTGETSAESTANTNVAVGDAVSVATSGSQWVYTGPMEPGLVQVTVASMRRSDGRMNTWTGVVRLTP